MNPKALALQARTAAFFQRVIKLSESLPDTAPARSIKGQLLDAAGSIDSNYRAACRGRTAKEFISKLGVAAEEADESKGWLEALATAGIDTSPETRSLIQEANELTAIFVASMKTAKRNAAKRARRLPRRSA